MYKKYLLGCKALIKNNEGLYLQLGTSQKHDNERYADEVRWGLPGGRVEVGEEYTDVLSREVFEETGMTVVEHSIQFHGTILTTIQLDVKRDGDQGTYGLLLNYYECECVENSHIRLSNEHEQYRRVSKDQILNDIKKIAFYPNTVQWGENFG